MTRLALGLAAVLTGLCAGAAAHAQSRDTIRIVGSSTVFPFSTAVAEQFGAKTEFPTPVVESTGTGGGMKLFCDGLGLEHPDVTNASRRIKPSEFERCLARGVTEIVEIKIGYDGIVFANAEEAPDFALTKEQIYLALARQVPMAGDDCTLIDNPYEAWSDIDPSLPPFPIEVFGPPTTSGTRDAFLEIAMEGGAERLPCLAQLAALTPEAGETAAAYLARVQEAAPSFTRDDVTAGDALVAGADLFRRIAHTLRDDGAWIDAGENDNAIVNTLVKTPTAMGVFGFSFLDQNEDRLKGAVVDGSAPTFASIEAGDYTVSRSMYFYIKRAHVDVVPGLVEYAQEFTSDAAWGTFGYLGEKGLIPLSGEEQAFYAAVARDLQLLSRDAAGAFQILAPAERAGSRAAAATQADASPPDGSAPDGAAPDDTAPDAPSQEAP